MAKNKKRNSAGQLSLEILIAVSILALSLGAMATVVFGGRSLSTESQASNRALLLARGDLEKARAAAENDFNALTSSSSTGNSFLRETIVDYPDPNTKQIMSRVSWQIDPLRPQKVELVTLMTNWKEVLATGHDTGGTGTSGNWRDPQTFGSVDLGPGNSATGIDVLDKIIYLTASASDPKKPDFYIIDATNGQNPVILSNASTGPGLLSLDVANGYAFAGNDDPNAGLQVIDVSDKNNPQVKISFNLLGVSGPGAVGNTVFFYDSRVYLGTKKANGSEFHVIDVSNSLNPAELGNFNVDADVNKIIVSGETAYLATSDDSEELKILNVSDPAHISEISHYNATGTEDGKSIYKAGNVLYLGREKGSNDEFLIFDVSDSLSPNLIGSHHIGSDINGLAVRDTLAFLATSDSNNEFQVWDVSNPSNITLWSEFNFPQIATSLDYENNLVYVAVRSNDAFRIITSQ